MTHLRMIKRWGLRLSTYRSRTDGAAAVEMALWVSVLTVPFLSISDLGIYAYSKMQVENASQMAAQSAWQYCGTSAQIPAVTNCTNLQTVMTNAAQSTTLSTHVTVATAAITEGYYCTNSSGALQLVGTAGTLSTAPVAPSPNNCDTVLGTGVTPADYVQVTASYTYAPIFAHISVASFLPTTISKQSWIRLQ